MIDLKIDANNELVIQNGDLVLTSDEDDAIAQHIRQRLRVIKGEWFLDRTLGLPLFDLILEKNPNSNLVATLFKQIILETPGVTKLNTYTQDFDKRARTLTISFEATFSTGSTLPFEEDI